MDFSFFREEVLLLWKTYMNSPRVIGIRGISEWSIVKIPNMDKAEYDQLIEEGFISRIAFQGNKYPYIAPFIYVFDREVSLLPGDQVRQEERTLPQHPYVYVEIEKYSSDLFLLYFRDNAGLPGAA